MVHAARRTASEPWDPAAKEERYESIVQQPEKRLILAVLEDAVSTFQQYIALHKGTFREFRQVEIWLTSNDTKWAFSFVNICDALDLDVARWRAALARWRRRQEASDGLGGTVGTWCLPGDGGGRHLGADGGDRPAHEHQAASPRYRVGQGLAAH
jgi:hypothetical protein